MSEEINRKESDKVLIVIGVVVLLVVAGFFTNGFGLWRNNPDGDIKLSVGNSPVLGDKDAPVTIYEFSDFSCPYCAAAAGYNDEVISSLRSRDSTWQAAMPLIKENYVENGKVRIVFKYSPGHGTGQPAHRVAWCLDEQDLFWEFHDLAFDNQEDTGNMVKMKALAEGLGADMDALNGCLSLGDVDLYFNEDAKMGKSNGVKGTPAFIINGKLVEGAVSYKEMKALIDKALE